MEQKEPSYTVEKLKTEQPYDPAITLLGIYLDKTIIQDPFIPMFTTALFTIARTWIKSAGRDALHIAIPDP